jgi:hypothetical protein
MKRKSQQVQIFWDGGSKSSPSSTTRISDGSCNVVVLYGTDAANSERHCHGPESARTAEPAATTRTPTSSTSSEQA